MRLPAPGRTRLHQAHTIVQMPEPASKQDASPLLVAKARPDLDAPAKV